MSWESVALGEVATIERSSLQPGEIPSGARYVGLEHIESGGKLLGDMTVAAGDLASSKFRFTARHVLYGKLRPYLAKIACPEFGGVCSTDIVPILPGPRIDREFLAYFLRQPEMVAFAASRAVGINLPRLSPSLLAEFQVPLPPLTEQRRIAAILDQADALRTKRRQALTELNTLTQSIFLEMFGDPVSNPRHWPIRSLGEVGTLDRGVSKHRPRNAPELLGGPYPLVQTSEVTNCGGYIRRYDATYSDAGLRQSKMWPAGTLCITIAANIAKTGILTFDACFPDSVVGFTSDEPATVEYVRVWLTFLQKTLEDNAPQFAQKNINLAILRNLNVPCPPIEPQREFAAQMEGLSGVTEVCQWHQLLLEDVFLSIQHRAFRGEL